MAIVETRISVWEALAGRAPGLPVGPADPGLWSAVAERVNPAKARPVLRADVEVSELVSARGVAYSMMRSPDGRSACYLRLAPEEVELARLMDGSRTLARLVAEFARISGKLAPEQVRRVVADLAGNRMLEELPVDAFAPLARVRRRPWPVRLGRGLLAFAQGRRMVVANVDGLVGFVYRAGGRLLFTRPVVALMAAVAVLGLGAFGWLWWTGEQSVFLTEGSYAVGAAVLLGLNVLALACHELGHALAAKHAGRRVPSAGFLVYFGIPSVFVDTTDVWMAGRRARLVTTAAGPGAGLVLAGASALVGFAVPEAAPWCFKLSFAWYINAMFNLNPFLALDGYYLLMDWVEVPNLRARGLAWVGARLRRRPPAWKALDREGRLVALYGGLAVAWLVVALNVAYRVYVDRVDGLITGLWRSGWPARLLLVAVVAALMSPLVYVTASWVNRRRKRWGQAWVARRSEQDLPRRVAALRASTLRDLPEPALASLASAARWVHPRSGTQLVLAGAAQSHVYAVVDGAVEGRAAGDPGGTVRERVGAGGVVGLGPVLAGAPSQLAWYTAGTTLLAIPAATVATTVGPVAAAAGAGSGHGAIAEAQQLFAEAPALAGLSHEDRLGLASAAVPIALAPGATVNLDRGDTALLLAQGVIATPTGQELARGTMIGPTGDPAPGPVATARTPVRLFAVPAVAGLPLLLGATPDRLAAAAEGLDAGRPPAAGAHPVGGYPPLAAPPGPPPSNVDTSADGRFFRRLRWLLILVLLLALFMTGGNVVVGANAWAEMPADKALITIQAGVATVDTDGRRIVLDAGNALDDGDDLYVGQSDTIRLEPRALALVTYRGGATTTLCAGTRITLGELTSTGRPVAPRAAYELHTGLAINDTTTASPVFNDLALTATNARGEATNTGAAFYAITPADVHVSAGLAVTYLDRRQPPTGRPLACPDGTTVTARPTPTSSPTQTPTPTPSPSESPTPSPTPETSTTTTTRPPVRTTTTVVVPPDPTTDPPPPNNPPTLTAVRAVTSLIYSDRCVGIPGATQIGIVDAIGVTDDTTPLQQLNVTLNWTLLDTSGSARMTFTGNGFRGTFDPKFIGTFPQAYSVEIRVVVTDAQGATSPTLSTKMTMETICPPQ